jgi:hypothetical protein
VFSKLSGYYKDVKKCHTFPRAPMNYIYSLYGITLEVPFHCPILPLAPIDDVPDVKIIEGAVPLRLEKISAEGQGWQASPGCFLLHGGRFSGRFLVEDGLRITLHRNSDAKEETLCANLLTTVIVALLRQRGNLVLHANVVLTPHGAVAIAGRSGTGKSTTLGALLARGCQMVTDDVTVLWRGRDGQVMVLPGVAKLNLCEDAATKLGHNVTSLARNPLRREKVSVLVSHANMVTAPVPLRALYMLNLYSGKNLNIIRLTGAEKFIVQQDCIYGPLFPEEHPGMFPLVSALAEQAKMFRIERPSGSDSVNNIVDAILYG